MSPCWAISRKFESKSLAGGVSPTARSRNFLTTNAATAISATSTVTQITALATGVVGVGLFRSEFLFMGRQGNLPGEEEQYEAYRRAVASRSVRHRIGTSGRSREARSVVEPEVV